MRVHVCETEHAEEIGFKGQPPPPVPPRPPPGIWRKNSWVRAGPVRALEGEGPQLIGTDFLHLCLHG